MINTNELRKAANVFTSTSRPSNATGSANCTNDDLNKVINNISTLFNVFIEEIENQD